MGKVEHNFEGVKQVRWGGGAESDGSPSSSSSWPSADDDSVTDDAASSSSSELSGGPLDEMDALLAQLPIKRGLSKYYNGKSRTFASLASVTSVEGLAKENQTTLCNKRTKYCKSYRSEVVNRHQHLKIGARATITKRSPKGSSLISHVMISLNQPY